MRTRDRGLTLIEVAVASAILGMVTLMTYMIVFSASESYDSQSANVTLDARAREALEEIARPLRMSGPAALWNGDPLRKLGPKEETSDLLFHIPRDFDIAAFVDNGNQVVLDRWVRYRWRCDESAVDGVDNDGDGLVDEGYVEKSGSAGATVRICADVPYEVTEIDEASKKPQKKPGFRFTRDQEVVTVTLTVETLDPRPGQVPVDPALPGGPSKRRTLSRRAQTAVELRN